jgi:hypothetical protein
MFSRRTMMSAVTCLLVLICAPAASADDTPWLQTAEDLQSRLTECTSGFQRIIQEAYKLIDTDRAGSPIVKCAAGVGLETDG